MTATRRLLFAGPHLQDALDAPKARRAVGVMPDPMPADAAVAPSDADARLRSCRHGSKT